MKDIGKKIKTIAPSQLTVLQSSSNTSINLSNLSKNYVFECLNNIRFKEFSKRLPRWGDKIELFSEDFEDETLYSALLKYNNLSIIDTCTIDYFLFSIWCCFTLSKSCKEAIQSENSYISKLVNLIELEKWDRAKTLWILTNKIEPKANSYFSLFGTEFQFFVQYVIHKQKYEIVCENENCKYKNQFLTYSELQFVRKNDTCSLNICEMCEISFKNNPYCLFIEYLNFNNNDLIDIIQIPSKLKLKNQIFSFLCCTFCKDNHFKGIFNVNKRFYLVDDMKQIVGTKIGFKPDIRYCFYYLHEKDDN